MTDRVEQTGTDDARYMARALELARNGLYTTDPNPRVGCVIVNAGAIVGEGWHEAAGKAHAEVNALKKAGRKAAGATVYVTLEPCCHKGRTPPCTAALIKARVQRVVYAMQDPNPQVAGKGADALRAAGIAVEAGPLQAQAEELNPGFISRMTRGRPYVRAKIATSLDGRTAMASGESHWITSTASRADVQHWRGRSAAVLTGIGTVLADDPLLTVRDFKVARQPLRVIVDTRLSLPENAKLLSAPGETLVVTGNQDSDYAENLQRAGAEILYLPGRQGVDLAALLEHLAHREVNEVLVEAGRTLCGALVEQRLIDEFIVYLAPCILGDSARGMFRVAGLEQLSDRIPLTIVDVQPMGEDWRMIARLA